MGISRASRRIDVMAEVFVGPLRVGRPQPSLSFYSRPHRRFNVVVSINTLGQTGAYVGLSAGPWLGRLLEPTVVSPDEKDYAYKHNDNVKLSRLMDVP